MKPKKEYTTKDFSHYLVIGKTTNGQKFRDTYTNYAHLMNINFYNATIYGIKPDGKRVKLKTITN